MQPQEIITRRNLPHWYVPGAMHFVTYRLYNTIPQDVLHRLRETRLGRLQGRPEQGLSTAQHFERIHKQFFAEYDYYLDNACKLDWLQKPPVAALIRSNLYHHAGIKYHLLAYCVMPNHVHVLLQPLDAVTASGPLARSAVSASGPLGEGTCLPPAIERASGPLAVTAERASGPLGEGTCLPPAIERASGPLAVTAERASGPLGEGTCLPPAIERASGPLAVTADENPDSGSPLAEIMHSLKSYTAHEANKLLGRTGQFWLHESYDHWVRDEEELQRIVDYIAWNPVKANLVTEPHQWFFSSAHDRFLRDGSLSGALSDFPYLQAARL